jgi:hypothetical protein
MPRSQKPLVIAIAAAFALVAAISAWLLAEPAIPDDVIAGNAPASPEADSSPPEGSAEVLPIERPAAETHVAPALPLDPASTTVAWPVKLELVLVAPAGLPRGEGIAPIGSGGTARLVGRVVDPRELGLVAKIEFIAGANKGRVLHSNEEGRFGASDLYPGLSLVQIDGPGDFDALREVRLRQGKETALPLGFGLPGSVSGTIFDRESKPIVAAEVQVDGQIAYTDAEGRYVLPNVASGLDVQLVVRKDGFAARAERISVPARGRRENVNYTLQPGCSLTVAIAERIGGSELADVLLLPDQLDRERTFPWYLISPVKCIPGASVKIDDLPATRIAVRVFHHGAQAKPMPAIVSLQEGAPNVVTVHLEPAPSLVGTVTGPDGQPLEGVRVRLEAPDRVGATLSFLKEMPGILEGEILPTLPMAVQETTTDHRGEFLLTSWSSAAPARYLIADSADGTLHGARLVGADDERVDLRLAALEGAVGTLSIEFPGRRQGVPVVLSIQGAPRPEVIVPLDEPLVVEGLARGTWRLTGTWNGKPLFPAPAPREFALEDSATQNVALPAGAIEGQDEDTLRRAGRPVPTPPAPPADGEKR